MDYVVKTNYARRNIQILNNLTNEYRALYANKKSLIRFCSKHRNSVFPNPFKSLVYEQKVHFMYHNQRKD